MKRGKKYHDYKNCVQGVVRVRICLASKRCTSVKTASAFQRHFDWFIIESPRKNVIAMNYYSKGSSKSMTVLDTTSIKMIMVTICANSRLFQIEKLCSIFSSY